MKKPIPGKPAALLAYLTFVGCLIAITINAEPKHPFARFHIRQAFGIHLSYHAIVLLLNIFGITTGWFALYTLAFACWVYSFSGAFTSKQTLLPGLGHYFQKWFTFIP